MAVFPQHSIGLQVFAWHFHCIWCCKLSGDSLKYTRGYRLVMCKDGLVLCKDLECPVSHGYRETTLYLRFYFWPQASLEDRVAYF